MNLIKQHATYESLRQHLNETVQSLLRKCVDGENAGEQILQARQLFESLPLSTIEFGLAVIRLRNAQRYLASDEWRAAQYELRLLASSSRDGPAKCVSREP